MVKNHMLVEEGNAQIFFFEKERTMNVSSSRNKENKCNSNKKPTSAQVNVQELIYNSPVFQQRSLSSYVWWHCQVALMQDMWAIPQEEGYLKGWQEIRNTQAVTLWGLLEIDYYQR